tara:strand:- start:27969 stop:29210 length:1242 start_codon:yes stop_codon:yes gene_type:complete
MQFQQLNRAFQTDPRRVLGQALMQQGASSAPVQSPLQGLGRLSSALVGAYLQRKASDRLAEQETAARDAITAALPANVNPAIAGLVQTQPDAVSNALTQAAFARNSELVTQPLEGAPGAVVIGTQTTGPLGDQSFTPSSVYTPQTPRKPDVITFQNPGNAADQVSLLTNDPEFTSKAQDLLNKNYVRRQGSAPTVSIDQTGEETIVVESAKSGIKRLDEDMDKFEANIELLNRLDVARDLLADGMETGPIQNLLMPFRKIGVDLNLLSEDTADQLTNQEVFSAISNYLIPRMRAKGSGATSDAEGAAFARATITMDKNPRSNQMILAGMRQLAIRQNTLIREKEKWFYGQGKGTFKGFGDWADENVPPAFQRIESDEQLTNAIQQGTISVGDAFYDAKNRRYEILTEEMLRDG